MSRDHQAYRAELTADLESPAEHPTPAAVASPTTPFRIALLGDFSGRRNRGITETGRALAARRPLRVDRDTVDEALARLAPELRVQLGDTREPSLLRFAELEDFHPDRIHDRLPVFRSLRDARDRAEHTSPTRERGRETASSHSARPRTGSGSLLDEILGDEPLPPGGATAAHRHSETTRAPTPDPLAEFVQRVVAPHILADTGPARPDLVAQVDAAIAAEMRSLLHHTDFQALEAAWRSVDFLVRRLDTDALLRVELIDVSSAELAADAARGADIAESATYRLIADSSVGTPGESPWALLVGLFTIRPDAEDVMLLRHLASVARAAGAPLFAAAAPGLVGCPSFDTTPDVDDWSDVDLPEWNALRGTASARSVGLAAPRFMLRLPYGGRDGEPCGIAGFEELSGPRSHEEYLWGNPAVLCALLLGAAFSADGWALRPQLDVTGLPLHLVREEVAVTAKPCAEAILSDRAVSRMLGSGVIAVRSLKDGDAVRLARFQSIAEPLAAITGRWGPSSATDG